MTDRIGDPVARLRDLVGGFRISQAIHVAAVLGISDHLGDQSLTTAALARATGADEQALRRLMRALAAADVFVEDPEDTFANAPMGLALGSTHPSRTRDIAANHGRPYFWNTWGHLLASVQTGENAFSHLNGRSVWEHRVDHPDDGAAFDKAMTALTLELVESVVAAYDFGRHPSIVDIGGGQGALLAAILRTAPDSTGLLFDQPHVVDSAPAHLSADTIGNRVALAGGDFFEEVPPGGDLYLLKSVLHDWGDEDSRHILDSCRTAMQLGATLLIIEQILPGPNEGLVTKLSDLNMLVMPGGKERSVTEYDALLELTGFARTQVIATTTAYSIIESHAV